MAWYVILRNTCTICALTSKFVIPYTIRKLVDLLLGCTVLTGRLTYKEIIFDAWSFRSLLLLLLLLSSLSPLLLFSSSSSSLLLFFDRNVPIPFSQIFFLLFGV